MTKALSAHYKGNKKDVAVPAGGKVRTAVASGMYVDRDGDLILPQGLDAENFMKNPVMLNAHDYWSESVGRVLDIRSDGKEVEFDFIFAETETGKVLSYLYDNGFQQAFSVGFIPKSTINVPEGVDELTATSGGKEVKINLTEFGSNRPRRIISDWELLEISAVPVPALPQALLRAAKGLVGYQKSTGQLNLSKEDEAVLMKALQKMERAAEDAMAEEDVKGAVPSHSTPIDSETAWDADAAVAALAKWASSDGSGDKETINWERFRMGFAWYDSESPENFTSYKLPHHTVKDGKLVAVWRGIAAAMAALNGARGGVDLPEADRTRVWNHLARHYRDAEAEPPELRDYTEEELKAMEEFPFPSRGGEEPGEPEVSRDDPSGGIGKDAAMDEVMDLLREVLARVDGLEKTVRESEASVRIKWGVVLDEIRSLSLAPPPSAHPIHQDVRQDDLSEIEKAFDRALSKLM